MERTDYPAMLAALQPSQAVDILNNRVREFGRLNTEIADWLQERRRLEETYASGLRKLARRQLEGVDLGVFSIAWSAFINSAESLADSHSALCAKIEVDVERPLRDFVSGNREVQAMSTMQGNLGSLAKDVERARQKTDKLQGKGERADTGKVASASSELDNAQGQWESQAPYVFENLQAVDETRLNHLRDVLTQFQTHEVDQVEKSRVTAESCLNMLLNVETADEIKTFALKAVRGKPRVERAPRPAAATPSRTQAPPLTQTISQPDVNEDLASQRSGSVQEKKGPLKGLKRLGTVMGRRRESKQPQQLSPMAESPERKSRSSPFNSFGGRLGRSKDSTPTLAPPAETSPRQQRPRSPLRLGSEVLEPPPVREGPVSPSLMQRQREPAVNGASSAPSTIPASNIPNGSHRHDLEPSKPADPRGPVQPPSIEPVQDNEGYSLPPADVDPITAAQWDAEAAGEGAEPPAFNVNIRDAPVPERDGDAENALASVANKLQMPPTTQRRQGTVRGRRDQRRSFVPPQQQAPLYALSPAPDASTVPVEPTSPVKPTAQVEAEPMEKSAQPIEPQTTGTSAQLPQSVSGAFVPTQIAGSTFASFSPATDQHLPFRPTSRTAQGSTDHTGDTRSIRSGRSLTSTTSQGLKHPELHETGLSSSVVETVNARFENGQLKSSSIVGEIAIAYNPADASTPSGNEHIRLENFGMLEKVAPNPAFLGQSPGKDGEYSVNLSNLSKTQVALKYQVRLDEPNAQAPLLVAPAFKVEPNQSSIIVSYSLNPGFALHGRQSITLSNVMLALTLDGAKATTCLSKPVGTFARDKNLIYWQLGDVTLTHGSAPQKLLARFATESEAKSGTVDCRWELSGENARGLGSGLSVSVQGQSGGAGESSNPFADDEGSSGLTAVWKGVQSVKKLVSGNYSAR